jgi:hypothetical protein
MLIKRTLGRHVMVRLTVHSLSTETAIAALVIILVLVHVTGVVGAAIIRVIVGVASSMSRLSVRLMHMLSLRSRSRGLLAANCRIGCCMAAVLSLVVSALALYTHVS